LHPLGHIRPGGILAGKKAAKAGTHQNKIIALIDCLLCAYYFWCVVDCALGATHNPLVRGSSQREPSTIKELRYA